jgi:hypothetical protein
LSYGPTTSGWLVRDGVLWNGYATADKL